ncbi:MAG TPA: hypothetical protein VIT42_07640, partial [Microlunatus sp.]
APSAALADYLILWVDYALEQYVSGSLDERLRQLAHDPTRNAHYDTVTDRWSIDFDNGHCLVVGLHRQRPTPARGNPSALARRLIRVDGVAGWTVRLGVADAADVISAIRRTTSREESLLAY